MRFFGFGWCLTLLSCTACDIESLLPDTKGSRTTLPPSGSESERMVGITEAHNRIRAQVGATPPLPDFAWSQDLADIAQSYAEHLSGSCDLVHSKGQYGENLAFFGGSRATSSEVVDLWAGEKACYTYGTFERTDSCTSACDSSGGCGHYTQVVWRDTKVVGCGVATCANGQSEIWVCNYDPPGNYVGEAPY
jgi:uncharacterized protein YkwD